MTRRFVRWWVTWAAIGVLLGALPYLALSAPRPSAEEIPALAGRPDTSTLTLDGTLLPTAGAPTAADAIWTEPGAGGAPLSTASFGAGTRTRHSAGLAVILTPSARPTPSPTPRPIPNPSGTRAGTAGGSARDGTGSPASFNGLHPIAESWRSTGTASGIASHMGSGFPATYLALPIGPGYRVRICGAGGCVEMTSNDAGPDLAMQREGRVADLSVAVFTHVCGVPASMGLCQVSVTVLGRS